jgi:hypothetical protein
MWNSAPWEVDELIDTNHPNTVHQNSIEKDIHKREIMHPLGRNQDRQ